MSKFAELKPISDVLSDLGLAQEFKDKFDHEKFKNSYFIEPTTEYLKEPIPPLDAYIAKLDPGVYYSTSLGILREMGFSLTDVPLVIVRFFHPESGLSGYFATTEEKAIKLFKTAVATLKELGPTTYESPTIDGFDIDISVDSLLQHYSIQKLNYGDYISLARTGLVSSGHLGYVIDVATKENTVFIEDQ